jgi:hypothetical protein
MIRKEMGFRITKIGKTAVSVAIGGLMAAATPLVLAADYNISSSSTLSIASDTNSLRLYHGGILENPVISLNLNAGISILGQTTVGTTPWSIFTYKDINTQWLYLNNTSLTLNGNNQITGVVGRGYDWDISNNSLFSEAINPLANINILNSGNIFNNQIYSSNVNLNSGSTVQFLGNLGDGNNSTMLNYLGSNSTVTLGTGVTLFGNVTNTAISNSTLIFNGSGTITGSVGSSTAAIGTVQQQASGAGLGQPLAVHRLVEHHVEPLAVHDHGAEAGVAAGRNGQVGAGPQRAADDVGHPTRRAPPRSVWRDRV